MMIGQRLRQLREKKGWSQGDIEHASGLRRCYVSRVEHGHTVPSLESLERFAVALEVPLYALFRDGEGHLASPATSRPRSLEELAEEPGPSGREARYLLEVRGLLGRIKGKDRHFLLKFAAKLAARR